MLSLTGQKNLETMSRGGISAGTVSAVHRGPLALTPNHPRVSRSSVSPWRTAPVGTNPNAS
jgi:hypothetical protein